MAGHSQFKNIMYRKGAQDAKRARQFAKLGREILVAAREGADPDMNPRLRLAIAAARTANMPKDNIERAIKKATGDGDAATYDEIRYEGYGPGGVAIIVEALTDNRNRTASDIRTTFSKHGGNLGETGSVSYMFHQNGYVTFAPETADAEAVFEGALEAGADDVESSTDGHVIYCPPIELHAVRESLEARFGPSQEAGLTWRPQTTVAPDEGNAETLIRLLDALEDNDDVQSVSANFDLPDELMRKLSA